MRIKTSKKKKIDCLTFCAICAFYAFYAHRLFSFSAFCAFLCVWNLFVKENKTTLVPSFILLLQRSLHYKELLKFNNKITSTTL